MSSLDFPFKPLLALAEHAKAAASHTSGYGDKTKGPALILVGDRGVYFMSNGLPGIPRGDGLGGSHVVYATGCHPGKDQGWYDLKRATFGGDDGVEVLDIVGDILDCKDDGVTIARVTFTPTSLQFDLIIQQVRVS